MDTPLKLDTSADSDVQTAPVDSRKTARVGLFALGVGLLATALVAMAIIVALSFAPASSSEKKILTKRGTGGLTCAENKANSIYDYIVVGSGSGGATIASRLALSNFKVLVIEAGPDYNDAVVNTPAFWGLTQTIKNITIQYKTYLFSKEDKSTILYPRGMALGGSTVNNVLVGMTASPRDWDYIQQVTGDPDWSSTNMIGTYQPLVENCEYCGKADAATRKHGYYNITLPMKRLVTPDLNVTNPVYADLLATLRERSIYNPDANKNNSYDSWFYLPVSSNKENGFRCSFYRRIKAVQAQKPDYLTTWTNTFVTKLLIDTETKDACGVEYVQGAYLYKASPLASPDSSPKNLAKFNVYAKREVIVSGGQWNTPQLLQLSGIGDPTLLREFGIPVVQEAYGVGNNLQDRNEMSYIVKLKNGTNILPYVASTCTLGAPGDPCFTDYLKNPRHSVYSTNLVLAAMLHSEDPIVPNLPDTAYLFAPLRFTGFRANWVPQALSYGVGGYVTVNLNTARLLNKLGQVRIQSTNPFDIPLIQTRHLSGPTRAVETRIIIQHLRYLRKLFFDGPFAKHIDYEDLPGSRVKSDKQMTKFIRRYLWGHHSSCTCKMGDTEYDPWAVVNSKAQVRGITSLRICDISIFPQIPGYYPVLPIATACEKIAHDIIQAALGGK